MAFILLSSVVRKGGPVRENITLVPPLLLFFPMSKIDASSSDNFLQHERSTFYLNSALVIICWPVHFEFVMLPSSLSFDGVRFLNLI